MGDNTNGAWFHQPTLWEDAEGHELYSGHDAAEAMASKYAQIFMIAIERGKALQDYLHYEDDPSGGEEFRPLFMGFCGRVVHDMREANPDAELDPSDIAVALSMFGFVLGRTFQEFETLRLLDNHQITL
jgi:hypothetical protein